MPDRQALEEIVRRFASEAGEGPGIAEAALALAALDRPQVALDRYVRHLDTLADQVRSAAADAPLGVAGRASALARVMAGVHGYVGDRLTYDDPQNANLMRVIDRRKGLPVALGILYMHAARAQGWQVDGLSFPGHFLIRIEGRGERAILDPFDGGAERSPGELLAILRRSEGETATLAPRHYEAVPDRDVLVRLQNNIKLRLIRDDRIAEALAVVERMLMLAPDEPRLWREAGLMHVHLGQQRAALTALRQALELGVPDRHDVAALIERLRTKLH
jgi:regulator of sirC expression with transglutaminase-like and TPR domain